MSEISEKLSSLHLSVDPFADTTPLANLFPGGRRRHILEQMLALVAESGDIIAVVGASGSGKSTLADFFTRQASQHHSVARVRASLLTSPVQLLQEMFKAFVLDFPPQSSLADLQDDLDDYLDRLAEQGSKAILIVDDAHELGDEALSLLVRIALDDNPANAFHLVLLGEGALVDMLDYTCPYREGQPSFQVLQLPTFSTEESSHYLRFRFNNAGFRQQQGFPPLPFDRREIQRIHKKGGGLPGPINVAASQLLYAPRSRAASLQKVLPGSLRRKIPFRLPFAASNSLFSGNLFDRLPANLPGKYVAGAGALVVILLLAFVLGGGEPEVETAQRTVTVPVPLSSGAQDTAASNTTTSGGVERPVPQNAAAGAAVSEPTSPVAANPESPATAGATLELPEPDRNAVTAASQSAASVATTEPVSEPVQEPVEEPAPAASTPASARSTAAVTSNASAPAVTSASATPTLVLTAQAARIQALPADNYTLQLLGSTSLSNVEAFVARHASDALYWYETRLQGRPWYIVIHGVYPVPSAARSALAGLPPALRELQPWVRNISDVQSEAAPQ